MTRRIDPVEETAPRLEIRDLRLITAVATEGTLTGAGRRLNVTQPALSRHLSLLEERLGVALFARRTTRMVPTPAGELLLRHARELLALLATAEQELSQVGRAPVRTLRVGIDCYTGYHWLPGIVSRHTARFHDAQVEIAFDGSKSPVRRLRDGAIDIAIVTDGQSHRGFAVRRLFTDEYIAVVAPGHRLSSRSYIDAQDLAGERVLLMSDPAGSNVMRTFVKPSGVKLQQVADVQLVGAVAALAESEFGIGMVPGWTIAPELRSGRLVGLRLGRNGMKRSWVAVMDKSASKDPAIVDFLNAMATDGPGAINRVGRS